MLGRNENALIDAMRNHRDCKHLVREIASLPKLPSDQLLQKYLIDAPALYVVPGSFQVRDSQLFPTFTIAAIVRNVAGHAQSRKGDGKDLGVDQLMVVVVRAIHAQRHGDCNWSLTRGEMVDDDIFFAAGITAMELVFEGSPIELDADWAFESLDDFKHFHGDIDIDPDATPEQRAGWLQEPPNFSTALPDAQIDVQLPGASQ